MTNILIVERIMPNSPKPLGPNILAQTILATSTMNFEIDVPNIDQKAPDAILE